MMLTQQEKTWLLQRRITRLTDNQEVLIYPMGAERYVYSALSGKLSGRFNLHAAIKNKHVLIVPGHGNNAFLFAQAGAKSITVLDKDPVTIAWLKAYEQFYHYRGETDVVRAALQNGAAERSTYPSVGELLRALTAWYPPLLHLPSGRVKNSVCWALHPKMLRRSYIFYLLSLIQQAIQADRQDEFSSKYPIHFQVGELSTFIMQQTAIPVDTAYVPYLLGVKNGIESQEEIVRFITTLAKWMPKGRILVTPTRTTREFYWIGQRYLTTINQTSIQAIPELAPYLLEADKYWFKTQGLAIFSNPVIFSSG